MSTSLSRGDPRDSRSDTITSGFTSLHAGRSVSHRCSTPPDGLRPRGTTVPALIGMARGFSSLRKFASKRNDQQALAHRGIGYLDIVREIKVVHASTRSDAAVEVGLAIRTPALAADRQPILLLHEFHAAEASHRHDDAVRCRADRLFPGARARGQVCLEVGRNQYWTGPAR